MATGQARGGAITFTPPAESEVPDAATTSGAATRSGPFVPPAEREVPDAATTSGAATRMPFIPPADRDTPGTATTSGASTRSRSCKATDTTGLRALLPAQHNYGTTVQARPTLLVHVPATDIPQAFFSLKVATPEAEERTIYTTAVSLAPNRAGILQWQLPADAPALEVGRDYRWYFVLQCDDRLQIGDPYVDGWVRRIQPPAEIDAIADPNTLEAAAAYGRAGIWYDLIAMLAARYRAQPDNTATLDRWQELLASDPVGLVQLRDAPFLLP